MRSLFNFNISSGIDFKRFFSSRLLRDENERKGNSTTYISYIISFLYKPTILVLLLTSVLFSGCASTVDIGILQGEIDKLRSEVREIKDKPKAPAEGSYRETTKPVDRIDKSALKELEEGQKATNKSLSDLLTSVETLTIELQDLKGNFDRLKTETRQIKGRPQAMEATKPVDRIDKSVLKEIEGQQKAINKSVSELSTSVQTLTTEFHDLEERLDRIRSDVREIKGRPQTLETTRTVDEGTKHPVDRVDKSALISIQALKAEVDDLKDRVKEAEYLLGKASRELTESRKALTTQLKELETAVTLQSRLLSDVRQDTLEGQSATNKSVSELLTSVETLKTGLQSLKDRFEETRNFSEKTLKELTESKNTLFTQVKGLESAVTSQTKLLSAVRQDALEGQSATNKSVSELLTSVETLKTGLQSLKDRFEETRNFSEKTSKELTESKNVLAARIKELETTVNAHSAPDLLMSLQAIKTELQELTNRFESAQNLSGKTLKELTESRNAFNTQLKALEAKELTESKNTAIRTKELETAINTLQAKLTRLESAVSALTRSEEPQAGLVTEKAYLKREVKEVYTEAYKAYEGGRLDTARKQFHSVLNDYPENEYSENARFYIGEIYYKQKNYGDAILAYEEFIKKNPKSDKVPSALLKQGLSFYELKEDDAGRITLEKLIKKFPDSTEAKTATEKLKSAPL